jgi:hypothetical protein
VKIRHVFVLSLLCLRGLPGFSQQIDLATVKANEEFRWGVEAFHKGYLNEAILSFKRAISYRSNEPLTRIWLGRAYIQSGFEDAGLSELKGVLNSGYRDLFLQNWVELLESSRGLRRELRARAKWVFTTEIEGVRGENVFFKGPTVVRPRSDGSYYVVSYVKNEVTLLDVNGIPLRSIRGGIQGLDHPFDAVEGRDGLLYVSEFRGDRVAVCNVTGNKVKVIGGRGRTPGSLLGPQYLALDPLENLYVSEVGNRRISKFDREGKFLTTFGERSEYFEGLTAPTGILVKDEQVLVADRDKKMIAVFDLNGNYITSLLKGKLQAPEGLERMGTQILISDGNRLLAYDVETDTLSTLVEYGSQAKRILFVSPDVNGNLVAADFDAHSIHILTELSELYTGLTVRVQRVNSASHPEVVLEVRVSDRFGNPIVGLRESNFLVTERKVRVDKTDLLFASHRLDRFDTVLLVDRSLKAREFRETLGRVSEELVRILGGKADFRVISASTTPAIVFMPQNPSTVLPQRVMESPTTYTSLWAFDLGLRLATTELLTSRLRKAIFFLTAGDLPPYAFRNFGLNESLAYMRNNGIVFYPIYVTSEGSSRELEYLARETGGKSYRYSDPKGLLSLWEDLSRQREGLYVLKYTSGEDTDFGRRYIPVEVEARLIQRSGKDEVGYFGPLKY